MTPVDIVVAVVAVFLAVFLPPLFAANSKLKEVLERPSPSSVSIADVKKAVESALNDRSDNLRSAYSAGQKSTEDIAGKVAEALRKEFEPVTEMLTCPKCQGSGKIPATIDPPLVKAMKSAFDFEPKKSR